MEIFYEENIFSFKIIHYKNKMLEPYSAHWHKEYEIIYIKSGREDITINGMHYIGYKGDLFVCPPDSIHSTLGYKDTISEIIIFSPELIENFFHIHENIEYYIPSAFQKEKNSMQFIENVFSNIFVNDSDKTDDKYDDIMKQLELLRLWTMLSKNFSVEPADDHNMRKISEIMKYIRNHYEENLTLSDIARFSNYTTSYVSRLFKSSTGISFKKYLISLRIKKACSLLRQTDYPISEIMESCGFGNSRTFNAAFRSSMNISPLEYRKKNQ